MPPSPASSRPPRPRPRQLERVDHAGELLELERVDVAGELLERRELERVDVGELLELERAGELLDVDAGAGELLELCTTARAAGDSRSRKRWLDPLGLSGDDFT